MAILVDTGVLLGAADADDNDHDLTARFLAGTTDELLVTVPVIAETSWQIERNLGARAEIAFLQSFTEGGLTRIDLGSGDWQRVVALIETYADLRLGLVDASVVAVAERFGISRIATLNHRDFAVVRPLHIPAFTLLPTQ